MPSQWKQLFSLVFLNSTGNLHIELVTLVNAYMVLLTGHGRKIKIRLAVFLVRSFSAKQIGKKSVSSMFASTFLGFSLDKSYVRNGRKVCRFDF